MLNNNNAPKKVDIQDLTVFVSVYAERNLTLVADVLQLSPSTVSHCLKKLRTHFSDELFISTRNGMRPTRKASAMHGHVLQILQRFELCESDLELFDPMRKQTMFTVCAPESFQLLVLPHLMRSFIACGYAVTVEVRTLEKELPVDGLRDNCIDLALCFSSDFAHMPSGLTSQVLLEDDLVCVMDRAFALPTAAIDAQTFTSRAHVYPVSWTSDSNLVDRWLHEHGMQRQIMARANSYAAALQMVAGTDFVLTLPRRIQTLLGNEPWVAVYELPVDLPGFTLDMVWSEQASQDDANAWFREQIVKVCAEQGLL
jgi:DNA-binding transcriptional LysR family regulator